MRATATFPPRKQSLDYATSRPDLSHPLRLEISPETTPRRGSDTSAHENLLETYSGLLEELTDLMEESTKRSSLQLPPLVGNTTATTAMHNPKQALTQLRDMLKKMPTPLSNTPTLRSAVSPVTPQPVTTPQHSGTPKESWWHHHHNLAPPPNPPVLPAPSSQLTTTAKEIKKTTSTVIPPRSLSLPHNQPAPFNKGYKDSDMCTLDDGSEYYQIYTIGRNADDRGESVWSSVIESLDLTGLEMSPDGMDNDELVIGMIEAGGGDKVGQRLLWGLVGQGSQCSLCGVDAHRECVAAHPNAKCDAVRESVTRQPIEQQPTLLEDFAAQTVISAASKQRQTELQNPPLDLVFTTPKNTLNFVSRLTQVVDAFEAVENLLCWKDSSKTVLAMAACSVVCLFPSVLTIAPQLMILSYLVSAYFIKAKYEATLKNNPPTTPTTPTSTLNQSAAYLRNLQFIQNQMGLFVQTHDALESAIRDFQTYTDTHPSQTLQLLVASSFLSIATVYYIPIRFLLLASILLIFSLNSIYFRAILTTLPPHLFKSLTTRVDILREGIHAAAASPAGADSLVHVSLWENQRWWAGLGWIPHLFGSERSPWSDESGNIARPHKDVYVLPTDTGVGTWTWIDLEWTLDFEWGNVDLKEGWLYSNHVWEEGGANVRLGSVTRRRCWVRRMRFVPAFGVQVVAKMLPGLGTPLGVPLGGTGGDGDASFAGPSGSGMTKRTSLKVRLEGVGQESVASSGDKKKQ
ncbi:peroxisome- protein [Podochytrium sp. JEL0797]|nr:peroxisome- protein [Podochytrium sp. JEL0797]